MLSLFANAYIDGLVQDCSNSNALAMELLQSYTKPLATLYRFIWTKNLKIKPLYMLQQAPMN